MDILHSRTVVKPLIAAILEYSKICLTEGDYFFTRVAIHNNQVTSVTGELDVSDIALRTGAKVNHFVNVNKMVCFSCLLSFEKRTLVGTF